MVTIAATSPSAYWFLTRGSGVVALILLTLSVALGIANVQRLRTSRVPRFVLNAVHRNASLLAVVFLAVHIVTVMLDRYVTIRLVDVVVPFGGTYRPFWLGLGAISLDLTIAIIVTSLLRQRIGYRAWRATHWLAYASWPVALAHSLGTGSDTGAIWFQVVTGVCVAVVVVAVISRVAGASQRDVKRGGRAGHGSGVRKRPRDQQRPAAAPRANLTGEAAVLDRQALAGHASTVPVAERV